MSIKPERVQFNGGELSPWLEGRTDIAKYDKTAKLCRNFVPIAEGSLRRRGGTMFVAATPAEDELCFEITTEPPQAYVMINGVMTNKVFVSRGDNIEYEVWADGYAGVRETLTISEDRTVNVALVSKTERCTLTVNPTPSDATVVIDDYVRTSATLPKYSKVVYYVYKDGYEMAQGEIELLSDMSIDVSLTEIPVDTSADWGDWGDLIGLVTCSAVYEKDYNRRALYIRFTNGFLPVIFSNSAEAPGEAAEHLFLFTLNTSYNSVAYKNGELVHTIATQEGDKYYWRDWSGQVIAVKKKEEVFEKKLHYPLPITVERRVSYTLFYTEYSGIAANNQLKVYKKGKLVWELKGRKNG